MTTLIYAKDKTLVSHIKQEISTFERTEIFHEETLRGAINKASFKKPDFFILEWDKDVKLMTRLIQKNLRVEKKPKEYICPRFVLFSENVTNQILFVANDYYIENVFTTEELPSKIKEVIKDFKQSTKKTSGLQRFRTNIRHSLLKGLKGEYEKLVKDAWLVYPNDPEILVEYGSLCADKGKWDEAKQCTEKLEQQGKYTGRSLNLIARVNMKFGNIQGAIQQLESAEHFSQGNLDRLILLGNSYLSQEEFKRAEAKFEDALDIDENEKEAQLGLAQAKIGGGNLSKGISLLNSCATDMEKASVFNTLAISLVKRRNFQKGMDLYSIAKNNIEDKPTKARVNFNMGLAYKKWDKMDLAINLFKEAVSLDPMFVKSQAQLETVAHRSGGYAGRGSAAHEYVSIDEGESAIKAMKQFQVDESVKVGTELKDDGDVDGDLDDDMEEMEVHSDPAKKPPPKKASEPEKPVFMDDDEEF